MDAQCTPDPELVAQQDACQTDANCPCGSYCDLGRCIAECTDDADCADGMVCDTYGRCQAEGQADQLLPPSRNPAGGIGFDRHQAILPDDSAVEIVLQVGGVDVPRARLDAHQGAKVLCPGAQEFAYECMLTDLVADATVRLKVFRTDTSRRGEPVAADAVAELSVYAPGHTDTVTLASPEQAPADPHPAASLPGRYQGTMRLSGAGSDRDLDHLPEPDVQMSMPAAASVWKSGAGTFTIAIDDPFHSLSSRDTFLGTLNVADQAGQAIEGTATFPVHPFVETTVAGRTTTLLSDTVAARVRVQAGGPTLSLELTQSYIGAGAPAKPTVRWLVVLDRSADTTDSAPQLPAGVSLPADQVGRLDGPTPWESAFETTLAQPTGVQALQWALGGDPTNVSVCGGIDDAFVQHITDGLFSPDGLTPGQPRARPRLLDSAIDTVFTDNFGSEWTGADGFVMDSSLAPPAQGQSVPCRVRDLQFQIDNYLQGGGVVGTYQTVPGPIDACSRLQQATGCVIETTDYPADSGRDQDGYIAPHDGYVMGLTSLFHVSVGVQMQVIAECKMPGMTPRCAEKVACLAPTVPPGPYQASLFQEDGRDGLGDLSCASGRRGASFDFDRRLADAATADQWKLVDAISTCLSELDGLAAPPPTNALGTGWDGYAELYGSKSCVDVGRLLTALAVQTETRRSQGIPLSADDQAYASAFVQRLLSRWLSLHAFLATQSAEVEQMIGPITVGADDGIQLGVDPDDLLEKTVHSWDVLLAQHILNEVLQTPPQVLAQPDYRAHRFEGDFAAEDSAARPLASVILSTLVRQSELLNYRLARPDTSPADQRLQVIGDFMPRNLVALALAADLHAEASRANPQLDWESDYDLSSTRLQAASAKTFELVQKIRDGDNPLGIADSKLPLYFRSAQATDAGSRFTVVSDFIAGSGPGSNAWAPTMVQKAQVELDDARQAYVDKTQRKVAEARAQRSDVQWVEKVRNDYNAKLYDYCGPSAQDLISSEVFDAARCPVITASPECTYELADWLNSWTDDDLDGRFCMASELQATTLGGKGFSDADLRAFNAACLPSPDARASTSMSIQSCAVGSTDMCLHCDATPGVDDLNLGTRTLRLSIPAEARTVLPAWQQAKASCQRRFPQMRLEVPPPRSPFDTPGCVGGSLGEAYLDIVAATQDLEQARAQLAEYIESYDIAEKSCLRLKKKNSDISRESKSHGEIMHKLRAGKAAADSAATAAAAVKDCAATAAGADKDTPWAAIASSVSLGAACIAGGVEAAANIASIGLQARMDDIQSDYESKISGIENSAEVDICHNDAMQQLVGARAAAIAVDKAVFDLARAKSEVDAQIADANQVWANGHAYLQKLQQYPVPSSIGDPWYSERIHRYTRNFKLARRATYLAVRAVEYEFQLSSELRQKVYEAQVPDDLQAILDEIWTTSGTRSIAGNRPAELSAVVSLRDDILQVGDRSDWPEELRSMGAAERFHALLTSQHYAEYDDNGDYVGQRIPFSLLPLGALGLPTGGVSIYSQTDCAERLWSVNASLLGDDLYRGSDTSFVRLDVLKRNTFFSQWCGEAPEGQPFQLASVTPTRNLFREPGVGEDVGSDWGVERGPEAFSRARIQAFFGVDRASLEDPQYANGETSELAARGLYGDYALFIPAALISRDDGNGLVLDHIDDVLLRVDYVSVARP